MNLDGFLLKAYINELRPKLKPEEIQNIMSFPDINSNIEKFSGLLSCSFSQKMRAYATALIIYKLNISDLKICHYSGILIKINNFLRGRSKYESIFYQYLGSILSKCIQETTEINVLYDLSLIAFDIKNWDGNNFESFISVENQFSLILNELLSEFLSKNLDEIALFITRFMHEFSKLGFDIKNINNLAFDTIIKYIIEKNQFDYKFDWGHKVNIKNDYEIISYLFKCKLSHKKFKKLRVLVQKLEEIEPKLIKNLNSHVSDEQAIISKFNESDIKLENIGEVYRLNRNQKVNVTVCYGNFKGLDVLIKTYETTLNSSPGTKAKILNEIKTYEFLSKSASSLSMFFTYQGCIVLENKFSIILGVRGQNLMKFISENINNNVENLRNNLPDIISKLIRLFIEMSNKNIFHEKLSPYSFTIDKDFNIYMIDNLNSFVRLDEVMYQEEKHNNFLQTPQSYAAPEEKEGNYCQEKSCIYSLGLIILQLVTMKNVERFEENTSRFFIEIKRKGLGWVIDLLNMMIVKCPARRLSFTQLNQYVNENESDIDTESNSCMVYPDDME